MAEPWTGRCARDIVIDLVRVGAGFAVPSR